MSREPWELDDLAAHRADIIANTEDPTIPQPDDAFSKLERWARRAKRLREYYETQDEYQKRQDERNDHE